MRPVDYEKIIPVIVPDFRRIYKSNYKRIYTFFK